MVVTRVLLLNCLVSTILMLAQCNLDVLTSGAHNVDFFRDSSMKIINAVNQREFHTDTVSAYPQCVSFAFSSPQEALGSTCGNAVDYAFYLPAGYSLDNLET